MRVQLALNVTDLDAAIEFYGTLFDAKPAKVRAGYANFAIDEPPLKLVLIEGEGAGGSVNHLGVEVAETAQVRAATARFVEAGLATFEEQGICCYADQDKVWVTGPDGERWETYVVLGDADQIHAGSACCTPSGEAEVAVACC